MVKTVNHLTWSMQPEFVAEQMTSFWKQYWENPKQPGMDSVIDNPPKLEPFDPNISSSELFSALKKLKPRKARECDGFSKSELAAMLPELASMLLTLFNAFTMTGTWPDCQLKAAVSLLSKVEVPETPIDILGTVFRLCGKIMAGKMLRHLLAALRDSVFGSIPTRSCADLAFLLQTAIEDASFNENPLVGCSMDLTKAFNAISRPVLQTLATHLGWPHEVLCSYMNFLGGLQRFWSIGGELQIGAAAPDSFQTRAASSRLELPALKAYRSSKQTSIWSCWKLQIGDAGSCWKLQSGAAAGFNLELLEAPFWASEAAGSSNRLLPSRTAGATRGVIAKTDSTLCVALVPSAGNLCRILWLSSFRQQSRALRNSSLSYVGWLLPCASYACYLAKAGKGVMLCHFSKARAQFWPGWFLPPLRRKSWGKCPPKVSSA